MNRRWRNVTACALAAVMRIIYIAHHAYAQGAGEGKTETVTDVETAANSLSDEKDTMPSEEVYVAQDSEGNKYTTLTLIAAMAIWEESYT